jgi:hypothetical protein
MLTLISLINVKSCLLILKKKSTLLAHFHVYLFVRFISLSTPCLLHLCTSSFFQKIPPSTFIPTSTFIDFANFAPPPHSVIWAEPHSRSSAEQFGLTECSVGHYLNVYSNLHGEMRVLRRGGGGRDSKNCLRNI